MVDASALPGGCLVLLPALMGRMEPHESGCDALDARAERRSRGDRDLGLAMAGSGRALERGRRWWALK